GLATFALAQGRGSNGSSPEEQANLAGRSISEYQQTVLADGVVTDEEMRDAVAATVACIRAQGYNAQVPPSGEPGQVDRVILVIGREGEVDPAGPVNDVVAGCKEEYMERVDREYARQSAPSPESADALAQRFAACMIDAGYPPGPGETVFTTERMYEVAGTPAGLKALDACLRADLSP
ncbi:MAG: hypothetical protein ACRDHF_19825, partial [Tepidiformaceae bacterium]